MRGKNPTASFQMFQATNGAFGTNLLITTTILVVSIGLGIYLVGSFCVFIGDHGSHVAFILAYFLYATLPLVRCVREYGKLEVGSPILFPSCPPPPPLLALLLRLYVLVEGSESVKDKVRRLRRQLSVIDVDIQSYLVDQGRENR